MTTLEITPRISDKTARFKGAVAAGEHVAVTIKGGAEWLGDDAGANLTLRVLDLVTGRTLAVFPRPQETMEEGETPDAWSAATEDENDLYCELNLNTTRMVAAARHMLRVPVLFVMGDTDDPRTLYFRDRYEIEYWPERIGDTTPYDLDKWPKQIDEWAEQVATWTVRLGAMKLSAVRTEADGENPGKTTITLNDGTAQADTVVEILDGQVTPTQMNAAIAAMGATKQNTLTFDAIPTEDSDNPVKSGGVYGAVKEVADAVTGHVNNADIHVTAAQKTAWTAKYDKPQGGIPKGDLSAGVQASLAKADTAVQVHQSLDAYVNAAGYDSTAKEIQLKHDSTVVARIDATAFIKDGMVDSVEISGGNLVISFNTDAGVEDIEIPLTGIFNPANYYDKTAADNRFVQKETGKGLVAVDSSLTTQGAAADAKAVGDAMRGGFTEWEFSGDTQSGDVYTVAITIPEAGYYIYTLYANESAMATTTYTTDDVSTAVFNVGVDSTIIATRHAFPPTKTSQLTNDGAPNGGGTPYATTAQVAAKQDALSAAQLENIAAVPNKANASDVNAALAQKANTADLPYRLVEPGKWEFSGLPEDATGTDMSYDNGYWTLYIYYDGETDSYTAQGSENELVVVFLEAGITATRASLPGHLLDRANNLIDATTGNVTLTLPAYQEGKVRDLLVHVNLGDDGTDPYSVTVNFPSGETNTGFKVKGNASAPIPAPDAAGEWLFSFSECAPHKMAVSLAQLQDATVAGGS